MPPEQQEELKVVLEEKLQLNEVQIDSPEEIKVEVIDDTPPEDRGRKPLPKEVVDELEQDDLEEYSDKVKKRISQTKKAWHDERRAKETATREKEQALQFAQRVFEENRTLKQKLGTGEKAYITEISKAAQTEAESAKGDLKRAYDSGDTDLITAAQEKLLDAQLKLREVRNFKPSLQEEPERVQTQQQVQTPRVSVDAKAESWRSKNTWFGANKGMTAFALGLHEELVENGVDPSSDEYYDKINSAVRKHFPDNFEEEQADNGNREKPAPRKNTTVVAPATRSTAPRQVRLNASELALAKRFGLTPEQYAREKIKLEMNNG